MDYINLESLNSKGKGREIDNQDDFISLESLNPFNTPRPTKDKKVVKIESNTYQRKFKETRDPFQKLRTKTYDALPVPPLVVPIMGFENQVNDYQKMFLQSSAVVDSLTMKDLMLPYSQVETKGLKSFHFGKFLLIVRLFQKIMLKNMNYDSALTCHSESSEIELHKGLRQHGFNVKSLSFMFPGKGLYGVIVKIRKDVVSPNNFTPVNRSEVDAIFVYDSACCSNVDKELKYLKGYKQEKPQVFYLATMDTAEIRIHTYNRCATDDNLLVRWDTEVHDLSHDLQQVLLLQPSRVTETNAAVAWNDHLSQTLVNYIGLCTPSSTYQYKFPSKGALLMEVEKFPLHHPTKVPDVVPNIPKISPSALKSVGSSLKASRSASLTIPPTIQAVLNAKNKSSKSPPVVASSSKRESNPSIRRDDMPTITASSSTASAVGTASAAGIHPERMAMLETKPSLPVEPSSNPDTMENFEYKKRKKVNENTIPLGSKRFAKAAANNENEPVAVKSEDTVMNDASPGTSDGFDAATSSGEAAATSDDVTMDSEGDKSPKTLATDFATKFNDFFNNALQKFENDILNIKF